MTNPETESSIVVPPPRARDRAPPSDAELREALDIATVTIGDLRYGDRHMYIDADLARSAYGALDWLRSHLDALLADRARLEKLLRERDHMRHTFNWLLGEEGEFPDSPPETFAVIQAGKAAFRAQGSEPPLVRLYWWRRALRERWVEAIELGPDRDDAARAPGAAGSGT